LVVPGDAKALVVTDLDADGWPDLVASRNDEPALAFRNQGRAGHQAFGVQLQGPPGNPTAIGAKLTLTLADGSTQTAELSAGSGYLSQSSSTAFFTYPTASPPRLLAVSWPDGTSQQHTFASPPPAILRFSVR
jgi:hypothetical protein